MERSEKESVDIYVFCFLARLGVSLWASCTKRISREKWATRTRWFVSVATAFSHNIPNYALSAHPCVALSYRDTLAGSTQERYPHSLATIEFVEVALCCCCFGAWSRSCTPAAALSTLHASPTTRKYREFKYLSRKVYYIMK